MPTGYTRQDTTGQLANGNPIDADLFNNEYNAIESAMNAASGHNHDGTTGGGAAIDKIGPSQELEVEAQAVFPKFDNLIDLGKATLRWRNGYFGTTVNTQDLSATNDATIGNDLTVNGNTVLGDAATDTVTFNADIASNIIPDATATRNLGDVSNQWNDLYIDGTAYIDTLTVEENATVAGTADVTGDFTVNTDGLGVSKFKVTALTGATEIAGDVAVNTDKFTVASATGNTLIAGTADVTGDVAVNTDKFTVAAATGNTVVAGTLDATGDVAVNTDKFTVASASGNTVIAGTLDVTGATGIDGNFDINTTMFTVDSTNGNTAIAGTLDVTGAFGVDGNFDVGTNLFTVDATTGNTAVAGTFDVTGNQTNTGDLTVNGNTILGDAATDTVTVNADVASNLIPSADSTYQLGDDTNYWSHGYMDAVTTTGDVIIGGDLTVSGTTTTVNTETILLADNQIVLNSNETGTPSENGGIEIERGTETNKTFIWDETVDKWTLGSETLIAATVEGDLIGDVKAADGTVVLNNGTDGTDATFDGIIGGTTPAAVTSTTVTFNTGLSDGTTTITGFADEDDMTSDSATLVPTQQSVKAYVDATVAGDGTATISASSVSATTFSATADTGGLDLNGGDGSGWVIYQSGTDLKFKYNGVDRFALSSAGALVVEDNVTAYGSA